MMNHMRKTTPKSNRIFNRRGSALVMAIVTIMLLLLLGLAVATVSMSTLRSNVADATTNDSYYAAEAGVNSALDQLKLEVSSYYNDMLDADSSVYPGLYSDFASGIAANAHDHFTEPSISGGTTDTTFAVTGYDSDTDVYTFTAATTSTMADGTQYKVEGWLNVKRVDVSAKDWFVGDAALVAGGTLDLGSTCGTTVKGSNVIIGALTYSRDGWVPCQVSQGELIIDPLIGNAIHDVLIYPSYTVPEVLDPSPYITADNNVITWSTTLTDPVRVDTAPGVSLTITQTKYATPAGIIRVRGNATVTNTAPVNSDIYCDGNFTATSCTLNGDIYVHGDLIIDNGTFNSNIYCDGNITLYSGSLNGNVYCDGSITVYSASAIGSMFASGPISISSAGTSSGIIYSKTQVSIGNASSSAIIFSAHDIVFTGSGSVSGMLIAKEDIYFSQTNCWYTVSYSASNVDSILNDPDNDFFRPGQGAAELDSDVIQDQSITAIGRIN